MLALSRLVGERIFIGQDIVIEIRKITGARVVIAVGAPDDVVIDREEVFERKLDEDSRSDRTSDRTSNRASNRVQADRWDSTKRQDVRESEVLYANR